jgi:hypothetical protein
MVSVWDQPHFDNLDTVRSFMLVLVERNALHLRHHADELPKQRPAQRRGDWILL